MRKWRPSPTGRYACAVPHASPARCPSPPIVDDMEAGIAVAKKNNYSFRVVTLKGDIINSSGAMTGGSVPISYYIIISNN